MDSSVFELSDKIIAIGGSLTGLIAAILYKMYRNRLETALQIKKVETLPLGPELEKRLQELSDHRIAYAAIEGVVQDLGHTLMSQHSHKQGVIIRSKLVEHKSKRSQGFCPSRKRPYFRLPVYQRSPYQAPTIMADLKKILKDRMDYVEFALINPTNPSNSKVIVTEPMEAEIILDELEVTHDHYTPRTTSAIQASLDRLFGEVCHGIQETEEMLVVGTSLMGIGEVFLENGKVMLGPPQSGATYILTRQSSSQLVKYFQSKATVFKVIAVLMGTLATGLLAYVVWKVMNRYVERRNVQRSFEQIRQSILRRRAAGRSVERPLKEDEACVVCLTNPREVVVLDCGHIAICADCAEQLPQPHKCPVCRESITRILPVYMS